jgi:FMN phosphatase YigB (HAD superfamily)
MKITLVLDAMGVIFADADDVTALLHPYAIARGGRADFDVVHEYYMLASDGDLTPEELWRGIGLSPDVEDDYLEEFRLTDGVIEFLEDLPPCVDGVWCLSNDVGRWARKLRRRFGLEKYLRGAVISGDVRARKPEPAIYQILLAKAAVPPGQMVFVDDKPKNLQAAAELGIRTVQFTASAGVEAEYDPSVASFAELDAWLRQW